MDARLSEGRLIFKGERLFSCGALRRIETGHKSLSVAWFYMCRRLAVGCSHQADSRAFEFSIRKGPLALMGNVRLLLTRDC